MKKACRYCGGVHDKNYVCAKKPTLFSADTTEAKFRNTYKWRQKRGYILKRDGYLCKACMANLTGTVRRINPYNLSVHHIVSLREDYSKRLDDGNLITLCPLHHELSEGGKIDKRTLIDLISIPPHTL